MTDAYFARFPGFTPDPDIPLEEEFDRLALFNGWSRKGKQRIEKRKTFLLAQFDEYIGGVGQSKSLRNWQDLCGELRVNPVPESITKCKKALSTSVHVNLIDLINSRRCGTRVGVFTTRGKLVEYTVARKKFFPLGKAKENGLLKILLREIL